MTQIVSSFPAPGKADKYMLALAEMCNFEECCIYSRVNKAWDEVLNFQLSSLFRRASDANTPLSDINQNFVQAELLLGSKKTSISELSNVKDLKLRASRIKGFSPVVFNLVKANFSNLAVLARITSFATIQGRSWMIVHAIHIPAVSEIQESISKMGKQKRLMVTCEGLFYKDEISQDLGYSIGLESPLPYLCFGAISLIYFIPENGVPNPEIENVLLNNIGLLLFLFNCRNEDIKKLPNNSSKPLINHFYEETFVKTILNHLVSLLSQGTLTAELKRKYSLQLLAKRHKEVVKMCKVVAEDLTPKLVKAGFATIKEGKKIQKFLSMPPGHERNKFFTETDFQRLITIDIRNVSWIRNIQAADKLVPKEVPGILSGGSEHIDTVVAGLQKTESKETSWAGSQSHAGKKKK